jgi:hypothetical protein
VSKEAALFPIHFFDRALFCERCAQIEKFRVFSQKKYDKTYGKSEIPSNKPLFCRCEKCDSVVIYATNEFAELLEDATHGLCKIWGRGNLETGDRVFHPTEKLCTVEGVNRVFNALPSIVIANQKKEKIEIQTDYPLASDENSNVYYRLFPQQAENARLGDLVYHTETGLVSKVVGLEFNGGQHIIVKYETGNIEKCKCNSNSNYLTDELLNLNAKWRCKELPYSETMQIHSRAKILYVACLVPNFHAISELNKIISSIPQVRCVITHIDVEKSNLTSNDIYKELVKNCVNICCCRVEIENKEVYIEGFYSAKDTPKNIYRILSKYPLKKINLNIKLRSNIKTIKTINEEECFIRISKMEKKFHIDGWVKNEIEKRKAKRNAFFSTFSFKIENHLLVFG